MRKWIWASLFLSLVSCFGHFYLSKRSYQLKAGETAQQSWCHINEKISCDSALTSSYAEIFNVSISVFGLSFNLFLSALILLFLLFGAGSYWKSMAFYLSEWIAFGSILMGLISIFAHLFCPICIALYLISFALPVGLFFAFRQDMQKPLNFLKGALRKKSFYIFSAGMVLTGLFLHANFMSHFDIKSHEQKMAWLFQDWLHEKEAEMPITQPALQRMASEATKMELVEFVDFLCPFCKKTQPALKAFLESYPDVSFKLYLFPLDSACNPSVDFIKTGLSCELSKALICAERQNKGWQTHDFIFENQGVFLKARGDKKKIKTLFESLLHETKLQEDEFSACMKEAKVLERIKKSARAGKVAQIQGTPSYFINGKQVKQHSHKLFILKKAYQHLNK